VVLTGRRIVIALACLLLGLLLPAASLRAETGYDAWLRYARLDDKTAQDQFAELPAIVVAPGDSDVVKSAQEELIRGVRGMLGRTLRTQAELPKENAILLGTFDNVKQVLPSIGKLPQLAEKAFGSKRLTRQLLSDHRIDRRGVLHTRSRCCGRSLWVRNLRAQLAAPPYAPLRDQSWDNPTARSNADTRANRSFGRAGMLYRT
jgi:alpha-glucuronidase